MNILERIKGSFQKTFDAAQPADVSELRKRCLSATQLDNMRQILRDWRELGAKHDAYRFPSRRLEVLLWHYNLQKLEDAKDDVRLAIERVVYEGDQREILHQDAMVRERADPIIARARAAVVDAHATIVPHLKTEIEKLTAALDVIFAKYGCCHEIPDTGPVRMLTRCLVDSQGIANGALNENGGQVFIFTGGDVERGLGEWL